MLIDEVWISPAMIAEISALTDVHRTTVARWIERRKLPRAVLQLMKLTHHGRLGEIHTAWQDWSIDVRRADLVTPVGETISAGEIMALPYRLHLAATLERQLRELRGQAHENASTTDDYSRDQRRTRTG